MSLYNGMSAKGFERCSFVVLRSCYGYDRGHESCHPFLEGSKFKVDADVW